MRSIFRKFRKPAHTKPLDYARSDLWRSCLALGSGAAVLTLGLPIAAALSPIVLGFIVHGAALLGPWGVLAAQHLSSVLAPMALTASVLGASTSVLQAALYFDFYARRRNEDGRGNAFTKAFTRLWAKTPLIILTQMKLEEDRRDETLRRHFQTLDRRINDEGSEEKQDAYRRDSKAYARILKTIYPNNDLIPSAAGAMTSVSFAKGTLTTIAQGLSWLALPVKLAVAGVSAVYALMHLSMFIAKKSASAIYTPYFDKIDRFIRKTPLQKLAHFRLRQQIRKIDALDITPELTRDLVSLSIDDTLQDLARKSDTPCQGMLRTLFNVAAAEEIQKVEAKPACVASGSSFAHPCVPAERTPQPVG